MLRIKRLEYTPFGALEEVDMGPVPPGLEPIAQEYRSFSYTVEGATFHNCYVESESEKQPTSWKLLGYAFILAVTTGAGFALRLVLDVLKSH